MIDGLTLPERWARSLRKKNIVAAREQKQDAAEEKGPDVSRHYLYHCEIMELRLLDLLYVHRFPVLVCLVFSFFFWECTCF